MGVVVEGVGEWVRVRGVLLVLQTQIKTQWHSFKRGEPVTMFQVSRNALCAAGALIQR